MEKHKANKISFYTATTLKLILLGIIIGIACGIVGGAFFLSIAFVTNLRVTFGWLLYLLPLGGILSVFTYKLFKVTNVGTDDSVESAHTDKKVSPLLTPAVFICSAISHLFGASTGREGAALKIGSGISAFFSKVFKLDERTRRTISLAGMSGLFSAVFGTPVCAALFTVEVVRSRSIRWWGILISALSSFCAYVVARFVGMIPEKYSIGIMPDISPITLLKVLLLAIAGGIVAYIFCVSMEHFAHFCKKALKNDYLRIAVLAIVIVALSLLFKTTDYNGGGINIIEGIFHGNSAKPEAFALKMLFTIITVAAGFKGGEIVPSLFIGATLGAVLAPVLGLSSAFGASIGMTALFCGVTNCPISTLLLSVELFGLEGILFFTITVVTSFLCSGEPCLYNIKKFSFNR